MPASGSGSWSHFMRNREKVLPMNRELRIHQHLPSDSV
jgi:hypothetical protein